MEEKLNKETKLQLIGMMAEFFRFMLSLDEYTTGLVCNTVIPQDGEDTSVKTLSRLRGCSRRVIHRKMLDAISENPELAALFVPLLRKISAAKRSFVLKSSLAGA